MHGYYVLIVLGLLQTRAVSSMDPNLFKSVNARSFHKTNYYAKEFCENIENFKPFP